MDDYRDITPRQWLWLFSTGSDIIYHCDEDWLIANLKVEDLGGVRWTESMIIHLLNAGFTSVAWWIMDHCDIAWQG